MKMANETMALCPEEPLAGVISILQDNDESGLSALDRLIQTYPFDPRLHFLRGSVLAGAQRYADGRMAMARAIEIAPDYALARFQLGFLELTSGMPAEAKATWDPFSYLSEDQPFRLLSEGLNHMARDEFTDAVRLIHRGMELNTEHPLINGDMQLVLDEIGDRAIPEMAQAGTAEPASATQMLLHQFKLKDSANVKKH
jgi:tetratricopeptide (TPR) repeat protein